MKQGQLRSLFGWRMAKGEQREERRRNGGERRGKKNRREEGSLFLEISDSSHP